MARSFIWRLERLIGFGGINLRPPPYDLVIVNLHVPEIAQHVDIIREALTGGRNDFRALYCNDVNVLLRLKGQEPIR